MNIVVNEDSTLGKIELGEDYPELRDTVRRICVGYPGAYWRKLDAESAYPSDFVNELTSAGLLAALIPVEFGGSGLPLRAAAVILETINASGCTASQSHAQMYMMGSILRHGSQAQKKKYLPKIAAGELRLQAFGVTEPTSGTDTTNLRTVAVADGDEYVLNGQKVWTSRALYSDLMLVLARTAPKEERQKRTDGLSLFLVDIQHSLGHGLDIRPIDTMINHSTTEVFFDDLRVPAENMIGEEGKGFRYLLDGLNAERILVATECVGDGRWCVDRAVEYANSRKIFDRSIGKNQGIQFPIAECHMELEAADMMCRRAAALFESGGDAGFSANAAKYLAAEATFHAADVALQTHGGFGFATEYDIERKWRETRLYKIAPISSNMVLSYVAEHVLKMERSY